MNFGLIIVGDEILSGKRQDKHLPKVIELLGARGLELALGALCRRRPRAHHRRAAHAFASGDVVFSCGGIGATPDDHTRQCAAAALGAPLALHPEAKALILRAHARRRARAGRALRARPGRQPASAEHGRVPGGRRDHPQPVQQDPGLLGRRRALRAGLSGDGASDDRGAARHALPRTCTARRRSASGR